MQATVDNTLYRNVVRVTHAYFGPAADRFVTRQIRTHLDKDPEQLRARDLTQLINWMSIAMALLVDDEALINNYVAELDRLLTSKQK